MDYKAGFSAAALTIASTAAFVKYESGLLKEEMITLRADIKEDMRTLRADIKEDTRKLDNDIQKLDNNMREGFKKLESKMDQLLFHLAGIQPPPKVCQTET